MRPADQKRWIAWIPVLFWMGLIFMLSDQPDLRSGFEREWDFVLRKLAHVGEYAIFAWLAGRAMLGYNQSRRRALLWAAAFCLAFAVSDEWHQTFIPGRSGAWTDVAVDSFGITLGTIWKSRRSGGFANVR